MHGKSSRTRVVGIRLKNETYEKVLRRVLKIGKYKTVASYLQDRLEYDLNRKHG